MQIDESQFYRNQLWTAPELLRMTTRPITGTQKADVYSFAIVLQEITFRAEPYFVDSESLQGKLHLAELKYQESRTISCDLCELNNKFNHSNLLNVFLQRLAISVLYRKSYLRSRPAICEF